MKATEQKAKKSSEKSVEPMPQSSTGGLMSMNTLDNFFDDFLLRKWHSLTDWSMPTLLEMHYPRVDILDHDSDIEVQAALPGIKKEDLDVSFNNQSITIRACTHEEKKEEEKNKYFRHEIMRGEFHRTLSLPEDVDGDKAKASFRDGILTVTIPKTEKNKRKIIEVH